MAGQNAAEYTELKRMLSATDVGGLLEAKRYTSHYLTPQRLQSWNQQASPLLRLPRELRDQIISNALVDRYPVDIPCRDEPEQAKRDQESYTLPALLQACHQLREEAAEIYYQDNNFDAASDALLEWLPQLTSEHRKLIKTIRCTASCRLHWWHHNQSAAAEVAGKVEVEMGLRVGSVWAEVGDWAAGDKAWVSSGGVKNDFEDVE